MFPSFGMMWHGQRKPLPEWCVNLPHSGPDDFSNASHD
jgi:hypothetical protein